MTSKNSFWVDLRENNKRRLWLWVISWLFFLLYSVLGITLVMSIQKNRTNNNSYYSDELEKYRIMVETVEGFFNASIFVLLAVAIIFSVFSAMQGFSYLNKRRQIDFYHSLPVKKGRRFLLIWLNGILIYLIPSLVSNMLAILIAAVQGFISMKFFGGFMVMYLVILILFLVLYHVNLIAVMLTGNVVIGFCAIIILQGYEAVIYGLRYVLMTEFFEKFSMLGNEWSLYFTPYFWYAVVQDSYEDAIAYKAIFWLVIQGVSFLAIAFFLYCKRPAEAAGRAMAFKISQPITKIAIAVPAGLFIAMAFRNITSYGYYENGNPIFIALGLIIAIVIVCCLIEIIFESDVKAALKNKRYILICGILATLIFLVFRFDIFGYDKYIPSPEKLKSYAVRLPNINDDYFWEDGSRAWVEDYIAANMFLVDAENICTLAANQADERLNTIDVMYRLKNGRNVSRKIWLDYSQPETLALLNNIVSATEYKKGAFMVMADYFDDIWLKEIAGYTSNAQYQFGAYAYWIPQKDIERVFMAYRQDINSLNFTDLNRSLSYGEIYLNRLTNDDYGRYYDQRLPWSATFEIVEGCVRTLAIFDELGIDITTPIRAADIEQIVISRYDVYVDNANWGYRDEVYTDPEDIEQIVANLWAFNQYRYYDSLLADLYEPEYNVSVLLYEPDMNNLTYRYNYTQYQFLKGGVPDFVKVNFGVWP